MCKRKGNIKTDFKEIGCEESSGSGYDPVTGSCEYVNGPSNSIKGE
jgi:hypothetical protein